MAAAKRVTTEVLGLGFSDRWERKRCLNTRVIFVISVEAPLSTLITTFRILLERSPETSGTEVLPHHFPSFWIHRAAEICRPLGCLCRPGPSIHDHCSPTSSWSPSSRNERPLEQRRACQCCCSTVLARTFGRSMAQHGAALQTPQCPAARKFWLRCAWRAVAWDIDAGSRLGLHTTKFATKAEGAKSKQD